MKKIITILLTLCLCLILCACNSDEPTKPAKKTIQLTSSNYDDYFIVEVETRNYKYENGSLLGTYWESGTAECYVKISPKVPCEAVNVSISFTISGAGYYWTNGSHTITLNVPASGFTSKSVKLESADSYVPGIITEPKFTLIFPEVSGSVIITE